MLQFITSLSFLYAFAITVLIVYGIIYYRDFTRSKLYRRKFPLAFSFITLACLGFLWFNIHAPLRLGTFSNLDHHFIRHDGFDVAGDIDLGRSDTVNYRDNSFSHFTLHKKEDKVIVQSPYSEEPFYVSGDDTYKIMSAHFPASDHSIRFQCDSLDVTVRMTGDSSYEMSVNRQMISTNKSVKKAATVWSIFRDNNDFINASYYTHEKLVSSLRQVFVLRNDVSKNQAGELHYFLAGRIFRLVQQVKYDDKVLKAADLSFTGPIPDKSVIAWGIGFLDNNRNQFRIQYKGNDSFIVHNRFPVSYPLTAENRNNWDRQRVSKFLLSGSQDLLELPPVFKEGFLFSSVDDNALGFSPVLLSYEKGAGNKPLDLKIQPLHQPGITLDNPGNNISLPAKASGFNWIFSIRNTYDWQLGSSVYSPDIWQGLIFGTLLFFAILVLGTSLLVPAHRLSWVWQLLSSITIVLLTTRFFLYWRYKSFPPYEGLDLASLQQLNSFWNFGVIVLAGILLAIVFGFGLLKVAYGAVVKNVWRKTLPPASQQGRGGATPYPDTIQIFQAGVKKFPLIKRFGPKAWFFGSWLFILAVAGGIAALNNFDSGTCRHLSIALVIAYFIYIFISYRYSPLVKAAPVSWWKIDTNSFPSMMVSNPVKILLSVSLLAVFAFIDIGFSIVFLNFLLFNEAFLCINYAIAGLSAGSKRNAGWFAGMGILYLSLFVINLLYAPYIFNYLLELPDRFYLGGYVLFAILFAITLVRIFSDISRRVKWIVATSVTAVLFTAMLIFFPREKVLSKAGMTRYRIDVQIMPPEKAIVQAYEEGKTYEPVIRAAQNQWFINTFIHEKNNPGVQSPAFRLLPHAPQNKGAKYNAQATDLVASRFFIAEHGKWSVLLYVLLLLLPATMLASFYKLYPDFTSRVNNNYPAITTGFSVLNYLLISALLVILAATGKYIFFGQDLPFGSILSKQSILVPSIFIVICVWLFSRIPQEYYANRRKMIPGAFVFAGLLLMLLLVKPIFNKNREFGVAELAREMDAFIERRLQPVWDHFDTARTSRRLSLAKKDKLFSDSLQKLLNNGEFVNEAKFFLQEARAYSRGSFARHLDANRMLYLDVSGGTPQLAMNPNYFRIEPPPHLQQSWTGNVYADTTIYNIALWDASTGSMIKRRMNSYTNEPIIALDKDLVVSFRKQTGDNLFAELYLVNRSASPLEIKYDDHTSKLAAKDSIALPNPYRVRIAGADGQERLLVVEPDAFMKNYYVNGGRFYSYPAGNRFTWARNFAESISSDHTTDSLAGRNVYVSFDFEMMDSLSRKIQDIIGSDTAYKTGAEYGICIADGNGRLVTMVDFIKGMNRPDPNDKAAFNKAIQGEGGFVSQALLRKQIGNINLLRLNPGPGSTLKPIIFSAIASQMDADWTSFAADGFSQKQTYYGGERVPEYDFEKNNGRIGKVTDYLKYSDNYYHSNLLLLGSYPKQPVQSLLNASFRQQKPGEGFHWPYFYYNGRTYYLDDFKNWPGYFNGKASFGSDSSFVSIGLLNNFDIYTRGTKKSFDRFETTYDSLLFLNGWKKSGFILPEYALFDQEAAAADHRIPYDLFTMGFRGHVKGSSQVMIPPVKMLEAFGRMVSQSRNYSLTLNPYASSPLYAAFYVDNNIAYNDYLSLMREQVFGGMKEALFSGTAARLGTMLKNGSPWYYYAKTGTTGDNESKTKSKLLAVVISEKDIANPGYSFRNNSFYTIYFTSQNGPAKQNEEFQAAVIKYIEQSAAFKRYMTHTK